jgi:hypothetical protein
MLIKWALRRSGCERFARLRRSRVRSCAGASICAPPPSAGRSSVAAIPRGTNGLYRLRADVRRRVSDADLG